MGRLIKFIKSFEKVLLFKSVGHFCLKELESDKSLSDLSSEIIDAIIDTPYHFWNGEKDPSGQTFNVSTKHLDGTITDETIRNNKFYGFYDAEKITASDYKQIDKQRFLQILDNVINHFTNNDLDYLEEVHQFLREYMKDNLSIFHLALDREINDDMLSEWSVYDSFEGFLFIDREANKVTLVEAGED
jgi:hypothetical protein